MLEPALLPALLLLRLALGVPAHPARNDGAEDRVTPGEDADLAGCGRSLFLS